MESVSSEGLESATFKSLSFTEIRLPPKAVTLAEQGRFKNSYVLFPPNWEKQVWLKNNKIKAMEVVEYFIAFKVNDNFNTTNGESKDLLCRKEHLF